MIDWPIIIKHKFKSDRYLETSTQVFPIPRIDELMEIQRGSNCFYLRVVKIEYYFNTEEQERMIYILVEAV